MIGIYSICCRETGKIYIGSSVNITKRVKQHSSELGRQVHKKIYLQRAWNKYGKDSFQFNVIDLATSIDGLVEKEKFWIGYFDSTNNKRGYNLLNAPANISTYGTKNGHSKLSDNDVLEIMELLYKNYTNVKIADIYGVSTETISGIRRRKTWTHIRPAIKSFPASPSNYTFSRDEVSEVKTKLNQGASIDDIVRQYNASRSWVWKIAREEMWTHVKPKMTITLKNPTYKISKKGVIEIKRLLAENKLTYREIANVYDVSISCISHIQRGSTWGTTGSVIDLSNRRNLAHKLSSDDVIEIKSRILAGESSFNIAKDFDVSTGAISSIKTNRSHREAGPDMSDVSYTRKKKLPKETVVQIKNLMHSGSSTREIADMLNISRPRVWRIKTGATWADVG